MDEIIEFIKDMFKYIVIIGIIVLLRIYVLTTTEVVGNSMKPNLKNGDVLLVDQITKRFKGYERFDIVVLEQSPSYLTKRVIGLPGEKIKYTDGKLYVNGKIVEETFEIIGPTPDIEEVIIPKHSYYVLGDNRIDSKDSRYYGPIEVEKIVGKPFLRIWPIKRLQLVR
ncbi:MAG TPA: signal peptidase I [Mollicutes bacterium]|nr:signal peptidase I [Mollicutes bacterium]